MLRSSPGAPGHVKDPLRNQPGSVSLAVPMKQADQALNNLESLSNNKNYVTLKDQISFAVHFVSDLNNTVMSTLELLVHLAVWLYPDDRYLDTIRVLQF